MYWTTGETAVKIVPSTEQKKSKWNWLENQRFYGSVYKAERVKINGFGTASLRSLVFCRKKWHASVGNNGRKWKENIMKNSFRIFLAAGGMVSCCGEGILNKNNKNSGFRMSAWLRTQKREENTIMNNKKIKVKECFFYKTKMFFLRKTYAGL